MLFGKKKKEEKNPYYSEQARPAEAENQAQQQQAIPVVTPEEGEAGQIPLLPTPEPIGIPTVQTLDFGGANVIDATNTIAESKALAFVKLGDFKRILEDIKTTEKRIADSQEDIEAFFKLLRDEEDYINKYSMVIKELKHTVKEIASAISKVED